MDKVAKESIAQSLEIEQELLPFIPALLDDLWALGSMPELIIKMLKNVKLDKTLNTGLDLGCGKGAVCINLAKEFDLSMTGVDAFNPFLEDARQKALEYGVAELCHFQQADIREYVQQTHNFDLVIYASLGLVLGGFSDIVGTLREQIRPGGYMIIDDGYLKGNQVLDRSGYEHYRSHKETIILLQHYGDLLIKEVSTKQETLDINTQYLELIKKRAEKMIREDSKLKEPLESYIRNQEQECTVLDKYINSAIWMLQKK